MCKLRASAFALLLLAAAPVAAVQIEGGERIVIAAGEVREDDVIAGAGTFILEGTIQGDLVVAGGTVRIAPSGVVEGDLIATGRHIIVDGWVRDDARLAGAVLTLGDEGAVGDDLIAAGQSLETRAGSSIGGALLLGGGQGLIAGSVAEGAKLAANALELGGRIGDDVTAAVGEPGAGPSFSPLAFFPDMPAMPQVKPGLTVSEGTHIEGDLEYVAGKDAVIPAGAVVGRVTRRPPAEPAAPSPYEKAAATLRTFGALLVVGLLLLWLTPGSIQGAALALRSRPGPSLGWGAAGLLASFFGVLAIALATALLAVILGGLSLGGLTALTVLAGIVSAVAFMLSFVVVAVYVAKVVVAYLGGRLLLSRIKPEWAEGRVAPLLVGVPLLVLLGALPFAGGVIHLLAVLLGLGALWLAARDHFLGRRTAARLPQETGGTPVRTELPAAA